jgi:N utilization substance protein B
VLKLFGNEVFEMAYSRNKLQELTVFCIYQYLFYYNSDTKPSIGEIIESVFDCSVKECDPFVKKLFKESIKNADESIKEISKYLNEWTFDRLNLLEQAILLSAYTQFKYMKQPKQVVINVAVELAKKYCDETSYKFINGVLDNRLC